MRVTFNHTDGRFLGVGYCGAPAEARELAETMRQQVEEPRGPGYQIVDHQILDDGDMLCTVIPNEEVGP